MRTAHILFAAASLWVATTAASDRKTFTENLFYDENRNSLNLYDDFAYDFTVPISQWLSHDTSRRHLLSTTALTSSSHAVPKPASSTTHCFMIDAGSGGSRLHIFEFAERRFTTTQELSDVTTTSEWTSRLKPGLATFDAVEDDELEDKLAEYLRPLIDFAREVLEDKKDRWYKYPIYLKATGGMRTLSHSSRQRIMDAIRSLFRDASYQPFQFLQDEQVRTISGEEEVRVCNKRSDELTERV